jgi:hypothetical protein
LRKRKALLDAAAEKHPNFTRTDRGWRYHGKVRLPEDVGAWLVDWFQRTYPHEARAAEDAVLE